MVGTWKHPGGKLRELGPEALNDAELLAILISTGYEDDHGKKTAESIAKDIITEFGSLRGMAGQPLNRLLDFKGLGAVKTIRIAAAFEIGRRIAEGAAEEI